MPNYLQSIQPWAIKVLEEREKNPMSAMYRTPFAVLSSAAFVTKGNTSKLTSKKATDRIDAIEEILTKPEDPKNSYRGCIIANNINNFELSYSINETPVGIDFEGKIIKVENETGRRISTPIITSIDVDTEEANNTLKTTRIQVRCFTLKQLEMFELFFMRPGMNVLLEWGDSSLLKRNIFIKDKTFEYKSPDGTQKFEPFTDITNELYANNKWDTYCDKFSEIFIPSTDNLKNILQKIRRSLGSYEYTAGKVSEYAFTYSSDGTYDVNIEIIQTNQVSLALPLNNIQKKTSSRKSNPKKKTGVNSSNQKDKIVEAICNDFNIEPSDKNKAKLKTYEKEWFNFLKKNETQKDTYSNSEAYVSLRFVTKYLMNLHDWNPDVANTTGAPTGSDYNYFELPEYTVAGKKAEFVPVLSSPYLISATTDMLYPIKNIVSFKTGSVDGSENEIIPVSGSKIDATINGYNFHTTEKVIKTLSQGISKDITADNGQIIGNALNIFVRYTRIVDIYNKTTSRAEFLRDVLAIVNRNSYGLFKLVLMPEEQGKKATLVDYKFASDSIKKFLDEQYNPPYRFKPTTINSIVRDFNFNFQMDAVMQSKMFFDSTAAIRKAVAKEAGKKIKEQKIPPSVSSYKSYDYTSFANADGYYSINNVDKRTQEKIWKNLTDDNPLNNKTVESQTKTTKEPKPDPSSIIKQKEITFKTDKKDPVRLVYTDYPLIHSYVGETQSAKSVVSNIDISITIDGFSGLRAGECFLCDGIPEIYNRVGMFQIMNIKHSVSPDDGWKTTIEASLRIGLSG